MSTPCEYTLDGKPIVELLTSEFGNTGDSLSPSQFSKRSEGFLFLAPERGEQQPPEKITREVVKTSRTAHHGD